MTASSAPDISVVVCAYSENRWATLVAAIESVEGQGSSAETIAVIDHNPQLYERVRSAFPDLRVLENTGQRGLAAARNTGVTAASGSVVAFLDDDAIAEAGWLERIRAGYADRDVIAVGGSIKPLWERGRPRGFPPEFDWVVGCTYRGMPEIPTEVRNLIGANMSFRRSVILGVGGFQPGLGRIGSKPLGCEETDLCIRATRAVPHGKILYDPAAKIVHRVPAERSGCRYFVTRCYAEGLSKAAVARRVGLRTGLSSERAHAAKQLPRAVAGGIGDTIRGDVFGFVRSIAIVTGFAVTTAGLMAGAIAGASIPKRHSPVTPAAEA